MFRLNLESRVSYKFQRSSYIYKNKTKQKYYTKSSRNIYANISKLMNYRIKNPIEYFISYFHIILTKKLQNIFDFK